jgi:protein-S-isoprenylcysteine O-methyltransferase Ste14
MELSHKHFIVVALWILWCSLHSLLIAVSVTGYLKKRMGARYRYYRLVYNLVALVTLAPVALYSYSIEEAPVFRWAGPLAIIRYGLLFAGICLFMAGARHYPLSKFMGMDAIRRQVTPDPSGFAASGILSAIRHPWYAGGILIVWARDISLSALLVNIVISGYFVIGAFLEERKLIREFGDSYRDYQQKVSMLFPWKWSRARIARATGKP